MPGCLGEPGVGDLRFGEDFRTFKRERTFPRPADDILDLRRALSADEMEQWGTVVISASFSSMNPVCSCPGTE